MGLFTKDIKTMNDLFAHQLQDIYYAEKQLVKALPRKPEAMCSGWNRCSRDWASK
jgi:ferritin-like metal-binding protein YciE